MSKYDSFAYDPSGKKHETVVKNGETYTTSGERLSAGWTSQTNGGIYKMGNDGKGFKVDSHNQAQVAAPAPSPEPQVPQFNQQESFDRYQGMMQGSADAMYEGQKAQLDATLAEQIATLEKAYADAVAEGKISVRDAEKQFEVQKGEIEKSAYQQAEATKSYGNNMGIGHSQQMIGLQQSDNARVNSVHNSNATDRDSRINSIRDRITAISAKKDLDIGSAKTNHGYALANAKAQSTQAYMQSMGDFMSKDHFAQMGFQHDNSMADKQQGFAQDNMGLQDKYNKENAQIDQDYKLEGMATQDKYNKQNIALEFENRFKELGEQSRLRIEEMTVGHGFDMKKMAQSLQDSITMAGVNYGHQASLNSQQNNARMREISSSAMKAIEAEQAQYDLAVKRESAKYNPNTPEGKIFLNQKNEKIKDIFTTSLLEAEMGNVYNNPDLSLNPKGGKDYTANSPLGKYDPVGSALNIFTGKNKADKIAEEERKAKQRAIDAKNAFNKKVGLDVPGQYVPPMEGDAFLNNLFKGVK